MTAVQNKRTEPNRGVHIGMRMGPRQLAHHGVMVGEYQKWVRATDAQRVGKMGSSYFLSPWPCRRPLSNKLTNKNTS